MRTTAMSLGRGQSDGGSGGLLSKPLTPARSSAPTHRPASDSPVHRPPVPHGGRLQSEAGGVGIRVAGGGCSCAPQKKGGRESSLHCAAGELGWRARSSASTCGQRTDTSVSEGGGGRRAGWVLGSSERACLQVAVVFNTEHDAVGVAHEGAA